MLFLEAAALVGVVVWLVVELLVDRPESYATAVAMLVLVVIAAAWMLATAVAAARRQGWSRASAIVWQVLQLSVAFGAFQGLFAQPAVGWALLVPAVAVILLLLWAPVRDLFARPELHED
ncbi:hypothetical protein G127AT_03035 [Agromyces archimandritae]|uniref:Uncharacterized protein n=2 Tax=Agromyces archimandritae TaxID=2781962 RepID=A0A975FR17_9MICO|nr:hypothetical protein G127AT_03035 [Agromyces archimandritae]